MNKIRRFIKSVNPSRRRRLETLKLERKRREALSKLEGFILSLELLRDKSEGIEQIMLTNYLIMIRTKILALKTF